jgi:hypothetical protein
MRVAHRLPPREQGVKCWTQAFAVLQAISIALTIIVFILFAEGCRRAGPDEAESCARNSDIYQVAVISLVGVIVSGCIQLGAMLYGLKGINDFDPGKLRCYYIFTAVMLVLQVVFRLISAGGSPNQLFDAIIVAIITLALGGWYVYAIKCLLQRIEKGEITRDNPLGLTAHNQYAHGNVELGRPQHAQPPPPPPPSYAIASSQPPVAQGYPVQSGKM